MATRAHHPHHQAIPAVAFAVHTAASDGSSRYARARKTLNASVTKLTHRRVEHAHARITAGRLAKFAEFDLICVLSGIGAHLLRHAPGNDALEHILGSWPSIYEPETPADGVLLVCSSAAAQERPVAAATGTRRAGNLGR